MPPDREQMKGILLYLEKARRDTGRPIMVHQSRVKREKMSRIPESASILKGLRGWKSCWVSYSVLFSHIFSPTCMHVPVSWLCLTKTSLCSPSDELEKDTSRTAAWYILYGYM
ncbi:hypothetical protein AMECASPLE_024581 [Ameca splendens]|uniref:Uncharacterized protein n=1 Tax=Ameca splendens TaxID=208324 RepID=A0ABV0ZPA2_9TELE